MVKAVWAFLFLSVVGFSTSALASFDGIWVGGQEMGEEIFVSVSKNFVTVAAAPEFENVMMRRDSSKLLDDNGIQVGTFDNDLLEFNNGGYNNSFRKTAENELIYSITHSANPDFHPSATLRREPKE
jgi:hypothetical protein